MNLSQPIRDLWARMFWTAETDAERTFRFYFGTEQSKHWEQISARATGARMLEISDEVDGGMAMLAGLLLITLVLSFLGYLVWALA